VRLPIPESLRRRVWVKALYYVADDWRQGRRFSRGVRSTTSGTILKGKNIPESVGYIETEFLDYLKYGGVGVAELGGKRILVVGPGDNLGVGALFVSHGASQVVCVDKFEPERDRTHLSKVYHALRVRLNRGLRERFDNSFLGDLRGEWEYNPRRLAYLTGTGLEDCGECFPPGHFDLVFSRAVFEHLYDPDLAFLTMDRLLAPGGKMAHKIDLRDHEMFSAVETTR
jgi:SAM-dependent methyltransferase